METIMKDRVGNILNIGSFVIYTTANGGIYFGRIIGPTKSKYHIKLRGCELSYGDKWKLRNPGDVDTDRILLINNSILPEEVLRLYFPEMYELEPND